LSASADTFAAAGGLVVSAPQRTKACASGARSSRASLASVSTLARVNALIV